MFSSFSFKESMASAAPVIERPLESKAYLKIFNFFMVDLRDDFDSGHLLYSMSMTNKLYDTNLLWSTYLKIVDLKV